MSGILYFQGGSPEAAQININFFDNPNLGPYPDGTINYFPWQDEIFIISPEDQALAVETDIFTQTEIDQNEAFITTGLTEAQAIAAGWIPDPNIP